MITTFKVVAELADNRYLKTAEVVFADRVIDDPRKISFNFNQIGSSYEGIQGLVNNFDKYKVISETLIPPTQAATRMLTRSQVNVGVARASTRE